MQKKLRAIDLVQIAICAAILYVSQVAFSFLPNIELVSPLIIVYTRNFGKKTLAIIYIFALIQGLTYGFGVWWVNYLYVWTILYFICRKKAGKSPWLGNYCRLFRAVFRASLFDPLFLCFGHRRRSFLFCERNTL